MEVLELEELKGAERETVVHNAVAAIRGDVLLSHLAALPDAKLTEWCTKAEAGLQMWVAGRESTAVNLIYYELGRSGAASGIPVAELIRALILILNLGRRYVYPVQRSTGADASDPLTTFCDYAKYYLIRGYEDGLR
jgi:hypothetical protein